MPIKNTIISVLAIVLICSCGIVAAIDPPRKKDFFKGQYDESKFTILDTSGIYLAVDTCWEMKGYRIWESDGRFIKHTFYLTSHNDDSILNFHKRPESQNTINRYSKRSKGYIYPYKGDTLKCELLTRITIGSVHFNSFDVFDVDSVSFKARYNGSRPYKYFKTHWAYCSDTPYIFEFKKYPR